MDNVLWTCVNITTFVFIATCFFIYDTGVIFVVLLQQNNKFNEIKELKGVRALLFFIN